LYNLTLTAHFDKALIQPGHDKIFIQQLFMS